LQVLRKPSTKLSKKLLYIVKNLLFHVLMVLWRFIGWIWGTVIVGFLLSGAIGNAVYAYLTKGHFDAIDLSHLSIIQIINAHLLITIIIFLFLGGLTISSFLAFRHSQRTLSASTQSEYTLQRINQLEPTNFKLFRYIYSAYIQRGADATARNILNELSKSTSNTSHSLGICIFGRPAQGKTRLAWEVMRAELPIWTLVRWSHEPIHPLNFATLHNREVILWVDDIHEYANPNEGVVLNDLPRRFAEAGIRLIIVATCRDGEDQLQATKHLGTLLEQLIPVMIEDISTNEAADLAKLLTQEGLNVSNDEFDGTPGSLIFGIQRMTSRYLNLTDSAQIVLKAMKLLHSARIYSYTERIVKNVSHDVFGLESREWRKSYESLDRNDFIKTSISNNERLVEPIAEIYLERVVVNYPSPHSKIQDDWVNLKECFQRHEDASELVSLALSAKIEFPKAVPNIYQFCEECNNTALKIFFDEHNLASWAGTQNNLGTLFLDQAEETLGEQAVKLLDKGIEAFDAALTVYSKENTPAGWVMVQHNLAKLLDKKSDLVNEEEKLKLVDDAIQIFEGIMNMEHENRIVNTAISSGLGITLCNKAMLVEKDRQNQFLEKALQIFRNILAEYSQNQFPAVWTSTQYNIGVTFSRMALIAKNDEERLNLLKQSEQAHRAVLTVDTKENSPLGWALTQFNLGASLSDEAVRVRDEDQDVLFEQAIEAYLAALTVFSKEDTPVHWARTQYQLGDVLQRQFRSKSENEQPLKIHEAIQAFNETLRVYNKVNSPKEWATTKASIGQALYYKAKQLSGKEKYNLLQESVQAFHEALEIYTPEHSMISWSLVQSSLGISLHEQAESTSGEEKVLFSKQAVQAYYNALKGLNKTDYSVEWALAQTNLSTALLFLAARANEKDRQTLIKEGIDASYAALSFYSRTNRPFNYAKAQSLLGNFLFIKGFPSDKSRQIDEFNKAIDAYRSALEIYTKENSRIEWAKTQSDLGIVITSLFELLQENVTYDLAVGAFNAFQSALEVYDFEEYPNEWSTAKLGIAYTNYVSSQFITDKNISLAFLNDAHNILESVLAFHRTNSKGDDDTFLMALNQQIQASIAEIKNIH